MNEYSYLDSLYEIKNFPWIEDFLRAAFYFCASVSYWEEAVFESVNKTILLVMGIWNIEEEAMHQPFQSSKSRFLFLLYHQTFDFLPKCQYNNFLEWLAQSHH